MSDPSSPVVVSVVVSDGLIALDAFAGWYDPPVPGFWVMLTYLSGQALIAAGASVASGSPSAD